MDSEVQRIRGGMDVEQEPTRRSRSVTCRPLDLGVAEDRLQMYLEPHSSIIQNVFALIQNILNKHSVFFFSFFLFFAFLSLSPNYFFNENYHLNI